MGAVAEPRGRVHQQGELPIRGHPVPIRGGGIGHAGCVEVHGGGGWLHRGDLVGQVDQRHRPFPEEGAPQRIRVARQTCAHPVAGEPAVEGRAQILPERGRPEVVAQPLPGLEQDIGHGTAVEVRDRTHGGLPHRVGCGPGAAVAPGLQRVRVGENQVGHRRRLVHGGGEGNLERHRTEGVGESGAGWQRVGGIRPRHDSHAVAARAHLPDRIGHVAVR